MEEKFEDNQLDNILLDKEKNRLDKIKKIILLVASLALVFTISVKDATKRIIFFILSNLFFSLSSKILSN